MGAAAAQLNLQKLPCRIRVIVIVIKIGILSTDYLTSIQTGWEVVAGGTFVTNDFWTALQDEPEPTN